MRSKIVLLLAAFWIPSVVLGKHSVAPFAGYTPTYKFFLGGGYFFETEKYDLDVEAVVTFVDAYQLVTEFEYKPSKKYSLDSELVLKRGFDPYYGEGSKTVESSRVDVFSDQLEFRAIGNLNLTEHLTLGAGLEMRVRAEDRVKGQPGVRLFPDETSGGLIVRQSYDKRDRPKSPRKGYIQEFEAKYIPSTLLSVANASGFAQFKIGFSWFTELEKEWVLATNLEGAFSLGSPTYMYRYRFGGADRLRGFFENRFRGQHYYLQQTELRFPIAWIFKGGVFLGVGDIGDSGLNRPRLAYGTGIRITLPPDYLEVARIDFGISEDQVGLFIDFGYAF